MRNRFIQFMIFILVLLILIYIIKLIHINQSIVRKGDKFRTIVQIDTYALTCWKAPYTGSEKCSIPKNTILIAYTDGVPHAKGFGCIVENEADFARKYLPSEVINHEKYNGFYFVLMYNDIGKKIIRIK